MRSYKVALVCIGGIVLVWELYSRHSCNIRLRAAEIQTEGCQAKYRNSRNEAQELREGRSRCQLELIAAKEEISVKERKDQSQIDELEKKVIELDTKHSQALAQIETNTVQCLSEKDAEEDKYEQLRLRCQDTEQEIRASVSKLDEELKQTKQDSATSLQSCQHQMSEVEDELDSTRNELKSLQNEISELREELQSKQNEPDKRAKDEQLPAAVSKDGRIDGIKLSYGAKLELYWKLHQKVILGEDLTSKQQEIHELLGEQIAAVDTEGDEKNHVVGIESKSFDRHLPDNRFTITHDDEQEVQGMDNEELEPVDHDSDVDHPENPQTKNGGADTHEQDIDLNAKNHVGKKLDEAGREQFNREQFNLDKQQDDYELNKDELDEFNREQFNHKQFNLDKQQDDYELNKDELDDDPDFDSDKHLAEDKEQDDGKEKDVEGRMMVNQGDKDNQYVDGKEVDDGEDDKEHADEDEEDEEEDNEVDVKDEFQQIEAPVKVDNPKINR